jgi:hypothetical protein
MMSEESEIKRMLEEEEKELDKHYAKMDRSVKSGNEFSYSFAKDSADRSKSRIELLKQILQ